MQPLRFKVQGNVEPAPEVVLLGLKANFSHSELRYIVSELQKHLSPELSREEASPYPRTAPPGLAG